MSLFSIYCKQLAALFVMESQNKSSVSDILSLLKSNPDKLNKSQKPLPQFAQYVFASRIQDEINRAGCGFNYVNGHYEILVQPHINILQVSIHELVNILKIAKQLQKIFKSCGDEFNQTNKWRNWTHCLHLSIALSCQGPCSK